MTDEQLKAETGWVALPNARIYWEATGDPAGTPVLYLHGGPGGSLGRGGYRKRHDPSRFRTIGLDQRGCGKSTPLVQDDLDHLSENTTQALIKDIEAVREHLSIEKWIVTGASWGSTLALAYALEYPARVLGIALVAVTTSSREEIQWITEDVGRIFPEAWAEFAEAAKAAPGERVVEAYARRLAGQDRADARLAASGWDGWESTHTSLDPNWLSGPMFEDERERMTFALLVTHYWANDGFLVDGQEIIPRIHELNGIPGYLVHGRRDISGPAVTAWQLHRRWASSRLIVIEDEGHGGPASMAALTRAVEEIAAMV
ncbi:alpha/beta fold hydrolase [Pseudarthrobacter sulfonivorans]|uniref:alpha/beta fold hydrolase n=1 Tax=Pseudarthrobacter sulfonivorans TaxID=121292 RepID=UPI00285F4291|nr:alpha/beta fold hydrolase [Pseudarthrobacter sulfonivorans]MDR6416453.1 proline iminopeptidase [Pseudarthrobacter sulfonivorans]